MSIERSSAPPSPKAVAGSDGPSGKGKVKANAEDVASTSGGFSAILTSLDVPTEQGGAGDTPLATDDKTQMAALPAADSVIPPASNFPIDLAMLLGQAGKAAS